MRDESEIMSDGFPDVLYKQSEGSIPEVERRIDNLMRRYSKLSANQIADELGDLALEATELLAEERQINAGLRTKIANIGKDLDTVRENRKEWRALAFFLCVSIIALILLVFFEFI